MSDLQPEPGKPPRLAAIDVGTNTIRLVVAEIDADGAYRILDEERDMARLGEGLAETGRLAEPAIERSLAAIGKMKAIADGFEVEQLRAIATSAVREAANGRTFIREAWRQHKIRIEVISGDQEAQLAFHSASRHFNLEGRSAAVVDIGGGSLEVIFSAGAVVDQVYSLPLGAVRMTERFVRSDPLKPKHWKALRREIKRGLKAGIGKPPFPTEIMVGSGGTFTALAHMAQWQREGRHGSVQSFVLSRAEVVHLLDRLRETALSERRQIPGLSADRADIIVAGAAVVALLAERLGAQQILVNERGIRDGVLLQLVDEVRPSAVPPTVPAERLDWVRKFARKCRSNERHCEHVGRLARDIFDGLAHQYELPDWSREILQAGALLHDIGYLISHSKHHKHAYHLIMHGELPGYAPREIELIANVARYHRRAFPRKKHENLARLIREDRELIAKLAGILRIADGLDRAHSGLVTGVRVERRGKTLRLLAEAPHPPQVELWDAERKADLFQQAFGVAPTMLWRDPQGRTRRASRAVRSPRRRNRPRLRVVGGGA